MKLLKYDQVSPFFGPFTGFLGRDISNAIGSDEPFRSVPRVNVVETKESFEIALLAPGFERSGIELSVEKDLLTISAEHKQEALKENERYTRREFSTGSFKRSFQLPEHVQSDGIHAELKNGVLHISIPKAVPATPAVHRIAVQ